MTAASEITIGTGDQVYTWIDDWARIPDTDSGKANGRTHGVQYSRGRDHLFVFNQADPAVLELDQDGVVVNTWGDRFPGAHGMTLVGEGGDEFLWLTDQGSAEVVKTTLDGETVQTIAKPDITAYAEGRYSPTWVAVNPANGEIWVADGYGSSLVNRYATDGSYLGSITGEEDGALGRFKCPHGIAFTDRSGSPELWITDRGNARLQIYDGEGRFLRGVSDTFHSPCCFDFLGDLTLVPELRAGVKVMRGDDEVIANLGDNEPVASVQGWPNLAGTEHVTPGSFNSPHGGCFAPDGSIYIVEWIVGGRITKLLKQA